jgi:hypothetical protein
MLIYEEATRLMFATGIHADFRKQGKLTKIQTSLVYATDGSDESLRFLLNVIGDRQLEIIENGVERTV